MFALIVNIRIFLVEGLVAKCISEQKYIHLSNGLILSYEICHTYTIRIRSGRYENIVFIPCSVTVCINVSSFFLYLKDCIVIWIHNVGVVQDRRGCTNNLGHSLMYMLIRVYKR